MNFYSQLEKIAKIQPERNAIFWEGGNLNYLDFFHMANSIGTALSKKFNLKKKSIFVAGHNGMVGSAVLNELEKISTTILTVDRNELDLRDEKKVAKWFAKNKPQVVIIAAAKVGGIKANNIFPVDFLENNLLIQNNIIKSGPKNAFLNDNDNLSFLDD